MLRGTLLVDTIPIFALSNGAERENAKLRQGLAFRLFCYVPLHNNRNRGGGVSWSGSNLETFIPLR